MNESKMAVEREGGVVESAHFQDYLGDFVDSQTFTKYGEEAAGKAAALGDRCDRDHFQISLGRQDAGNGEGQDRLGGGVNRNEGQAGRTAERVKSRKVGRTRPMGGWAGVVLGVFGVKGIAEATDESAVPVADGFAGGAPAPGASANIRMVAPRR